MAVGADMAPASSASSCSLGGSLASRSICSGRRRASWSAIFIDRAEFERRDIDLTKLLVSHPLKKTTWSLALRAMLVPKHVTREYWQDEAGRGFVWITAVGKPRAAAVKDVGGKGE